MDTYFFSKGVFKVCKLLKVTDARWRLNKAYPKLFFLPHMERGEYLLFKSLVSKKHSFLEFGSGGSTIMLLKNRKKIFSVESNPEFYGYMNSIDLVKNAVNRNLTYRFVDIGPTNQWGKPLTEEKSSTWESYYADIWNEINGEKEKIDVVFIDGRFRVCCCLYSILKIMEYGWTDTLIVIHDFWRRQKYHIVLDYLEEVKSSKNLAVFRLKEKIDIEEIYDRLEIYSMSTV